MKDLSNVIEEHVYQEDQSIVFQHHHEDDSLLITF